MEIFDSCPRAQVHTHREKDTHSLPHARIHVRVPACLGRTCCAPVSVGLDLCVQQLQRRSVIDIGGAHQFPRRAHSRSQPASQPASQPTNQPTYPPPPGVLSSYRSYITREDDYSLGRLTGWLMFAVRARARGCSHPPRSFKLTYFGLP